jgi:hypothetical protein
MSTEVIEKPETAQQVQRETSNRRSAIGDILGSGGRSTRRPAESAQQRPSKIVALLQRIFEGHREFLGWTPD